MIALNFASSTELDANITMNSARSSVIISE
jgi:hypothetical protein